MAIEKDPPGSFYSENAVTYAASSAANIRRLDSFLSKFAPGAAILELGCGSGRDSAVMIARGFDVTPTDGTPEMAEEAARYLGRPVGVLRFGEIDAVSAFDGIWANACLLHAPRGELEGILGRIHKALRPGGVFYASFKAGEAEGYDGLGRYYNYPSKVWLSAAYEAFTWTSVDIDEVHGSGYDKKPTDWLYVLAVKG
ncbi:class I SAM-dependent methyltransferase [Neorhizobium vignae]|uniref:class I SAM-dependent methyltransferase n=1 Tax=Neorhizobium vignae TaxID=690585 RepID=UPI0005648940|nr:class I SAM-dependent methyltransferase [Neorhizobium vignae]